jgi:hypothetical protein
VTPGPDRTDLGLLLRHRLLRAWWRGADARSVPVRGALVADLHGGVPEQVPPTLGRVVSVQVVRQTHRLTGPRTYEPVAGEFELRPLPRSHRWSSTGPESDPLPDVVREETGVLVGLRLESGQSGRTRRSVRV